ncbi:MAG: type IV toxin-antitoxin system AbiEi family antitoxin domain-containing protein [Chloroflexota bacterium]|nr:type IV toxin-antitoxin system AbiEi family antitoxin domain-containing protein [Chloroflexota bacterium]
MSSSILPRSLSKQEARLLTALSAAGNPIFTIDDARAILGEEGFKAKKLLHRLCAKRWIERLERGKYRLIPLGAGLEGHWVEHDYLIAPSLVKPYYLAYATALRYYSYTERETQTVWIATTKRKRPKVIQGMKYRFVTLTSHKFFGFAPLELGGSKIQMAEREKAIADGFDHPEYCGGVIEVAKGLWFRGNELDLEKLVAYSRRLGNRAAMRRLGFWLELLGAGDKELWRKLENRRTHSYVRLDPRGPDEGVRSARWRLIVNVPERQLLEWRGH